MLRFEYIPFFLVPWYKSSSREALWYFLQLDQESISLASKVLYPDLSAPQAVAKRRDAQAKVWIAAWISLYLK